MYKPGMVSLVMNQIYFSDKRWLDSTLPRFAGFCFVCIMARQNVLLYYDFCLMKTVHSLNLDEFCLSNDVWICSLHGCPTITSPKRIGAFEELIPLIFAQIHFLNHYSLKLQQIIQLYTPGNWSITRWLLMVTDWLAVGISEDLWSMSHHRYFSSCCIIRFCRFIFVSKFGWQVSCKLTVDLTLYLWSVQSSWLL